MKTFTVNLKVKVSQNWIDDGFDLTERLDELEQAIRDMLPYSYEDEIEITGTIKKK